MLVRVRSASHGRGLCSSPLRCPIAYNNDLRTTSLHEHTKKFHLQHHSPNHQHHNVLPQGYPAADVLCARCRTSMSLGAPISLAGSHATSARSCMGYTWKPLCQRCVRARGCILDRVPHQQGCPARVAHHGFRRRDIVDSPSSSGSERTDELLWSPPWL